MDIGFNSVTLDKDNMQTDFEKISSTGYRAIELNAEILPWAKPHIDEKTSDYELEEIKNLSLKYSLKISSIGAHIDLSSTNNKLRETNINYVKRCIDHAEKISSPIVHILSG